jgi:hypothetical protein
MTGNTPEVTSDDFHSLASKLMEFRTTLPEREQTALGILLQQAMSDDVEGYTFSTGVGQAFAPSISQAFAPFTSQAFAPSTYNPS